MDPKTVTDALARISIEFEKISAENTANKASLASATAEMISQSKTIVMRDREIGELKKQLDTITTTLTREIDGLKAKCDRMEQASKTAFEASQSNGKQLIATIEAKIAMLNTAERELASTRAKLASETARADALASKYDPEIQAAAKAAAEAETKRQIAELETKLKALKKEAGPKADEVAVSANA